MAQHRNVNDMHMPFS